MAVPKKKTSKSRRNKRRSHHALSLPSVSTCQKCGETTRPHHVCENCGNYNGRQITETKE